jgi:hypothetical protein
MRAKLSLAVASVFVSVLAAAPADAACKKFAFLVNDYGKEGPTNDAKKLLDKNIAEWAAQNGITSYQTGKKTVTCELFLDVILFDEHTCTAQANVCWGAGVKPNNNGEQAEVTGETSGEAPPHPVRKADAMGIAPQQAAAVTPAADATAPAVDAAPTAPVEQIAAPDETPAATPAVHTNTPATATAPAPAATATVETGALQAGHGLPLPVKRAATAATDQDRAAAASAAASAAAAAERAAVAAETAANAAKEAAAAAVAASAASKGTTTVPPLDHASGATPAHNE